MLTGIRKPPPVFISKGSGSLGRRDLSREVQAEAAWQPSCQLAQGAQLQSWLSPGISLHGILTPDLKTPLCQVALVPFSSRAGSPALAFCTELTLVQSEVQK